MKVQQYSSIPSRRPFRERPFYGGVWMPPVGHTPGAVPDRFQPLSNPARTRRVLVYLGLTALLIAGGLLAAFQNGVFRGTSPTKAPCQECSKGGTNRRHNH